MSKLQELHTRTKREIQFIRLAIKELDLPFCVANVPELSNNKDLYEFVKGLLNSPSIWNNIISAFQMDLSHYEVGHIWSSESSRKELRDIMYELSTFGKTIECGWSIPDKIQLGLTFKTDKVESVMIYMNNDFECGYTNPNHNYKIIRIQEHNISCEIVGQTDNSYYVFGRPIVETYI